MFRKYVDVGVSAAAIPTRIMRFDSGKNYGPTEQHKKGPLRCRCDHPRKLVSIDLVE